MCICMSMLGSVQVGLLSLFVLLEGNMVSHTYVHAYIHTYIAYIGPTYTFVSCYPDTYSTPISNWDFILAKKDLVPSHDDK